jgi:hypothetical protein
VGISSRVRAAMKANRRRMGTSDESVAQGCYAMPVHKGLNHVEAVMVSRATG